MLLGVPIGLALSGIAWLIAYTPAPPRPPQLPGRVLHNELEFGGHARSWTLYWPEKLANRPALLLVLHGSSQTRSRRAS